MKLKFNNFQIQDSVSSNQIKIDIQEPLINNEINITRNTIEIPATRQFTADSARLIKPKPIYRPIIKTVPQIPISDSIEHPSYSVADNSFIIDEDTSYFDDFHLTPFNTPVNPTNKLASNNSAAIKNKKFNKSFTNILTTEQNIATKSKLKTSTGFMSTDWMLGVIILSLILFSWIRVGFSKFFQSAVNASYNYFTARRITEEVNVSRNRVFYFMNMLFYINLAMFITQYLEFNRISVFKLHGILLFFAIFISIITLYSLKSTLFYLADFVFFAKKSFSSYNFTVFLYNKMVGIILLPIISVLPYVPDTVTPWLFYTGVFSTIVLYILRIFRGLQISINKRLSIFYLILYLCALEILPTLIILKLVYTYI